MTNTAKNTASLGSMLALAGAAVAVGLFAMGPLPMTGQAPAKGAKAAPGKDGGKGGAKAADVAAIPRTKAGKPDFSGFWDTVRPGGNVDIEPQAKGGGAPKGGPGGPGGPGGGPGGGKGGPGGPGGAPQVAAGAGPGAGKGGPPAAGPGGPGGAGAAKGKGNANVIIDPADGKIPYTVAARAKQAEITSSRMYLEPELHCFPSGVPHNMWVQFGFQIIQNNDNMVILWEFKHDRRIIPLDGRPNPFPDAVHQFQGVSVGHWEGDTLVVNTKNENHKTWFDTNGRYAPEDSVVEERFSLSDANTIQWEATVTSKEFTQPMKLKGSVARAHANEPEYEQMEFACIEGNIDLQHYTEDQGGKQKNVGPLVK